MIKPVLLFLIRAYQLCISPFMGPQKCRFFPTCSNYAVEAIGRHGALKGGALSLKRVCKCHPWHPGGYDPVPASSDSTSSSSATGHAGCGHS